MSCDLSPGLCHTAARSAGLLEASNSFSSVVSLGSWTRLSYPALGPRCDELPDAQCYQHRNEADRCICTGFLWRKSLLPAAKLVGEFRFEGFGSEWARCFVDEP